MSRFTALAFAAMFSLASWAQSPLRPIKLIVPIPPGGAPDITARVVGQRLSELVGQPVVVERRPGSNGNIAMDLVAKSIPDGYTLALLADSMIAINPHLYKEMQTDPLKDLAPVASVVSNQWVLSVNPSVPVKNFREFVEYARQARPPLAYASGGNGSIHQLAMEMLKERAGIDLIHVPYKGGAPAATATVAGEVAAMFSGTSSAPQIKAGRLRALAVTGSRRSALFPDLPTISQFFPGYEVTIRLGLFARPRTPRGVFAMAGGYVLTTAISRFGVPFPLALVLAFAFVAAASVVLERLLYSRLYAASDLEQVLFTIGLIFIAVAVARFLYGTLQQPVVLPDYLKGQFALLGRDFPAYRVFIIVFSGVMVGLLWFGVERTRWGAMVRATVDNRAMAQAVGIDTERLFTLTFALGSGLAGLGGGLGAEIIAIQPSYPFENLVYFLVVVSVGGLGSLRGPFVAALLIGIAATACQYSLPQ